MFICECGRVCKSKNGLGYHKRFCGNLGIDNGYQYRIGQLGETVYIHREVMEQKLGRKLRPGELVHHKDENKLNNDPDNLELTFRNIHIKTHMDKLNNNRTQIRGSKIGISKLDDEKVKQIKLLFVEEKNNCEIARMFKVNEATIRAIRKGKNWTHVTI